jgi:hypothetical protein
MSYRPVMQLQTPQNGRNDIKIYISVLPCVDFKHDETSHVANTIWQLTEIVQKHHAQYLKLQATKRGWEIFKPYTI